MDESSKHTITKKQMVSEISSEKDLHPNVVRYVIQEFLDKLVDALSKGERIEFRDFGVFEVVQRKQKIGRNPRNASISVVIPERYVVKFTAGKKMKERVEEIKE